MVEEAQQRASEAGLKLLILPGSECYFQDDFLTAVEEKKVVMIGGQTPFALLEFPVQHPLSMMKELVFRLQVKGVRPVLAHPERYMSLHQSPNKLEEWSASGWFFQLDLPSLIGEFGIDIERLAIRWLKSSLFHIAATDMHEPPQGEKLQEMLKKLVNIVGEKEAERLLVLNPKRLLEGKDPLPFDS